ncbi:MAG: lysophospholipid acyltransferase family protein [Christensenellales bacterium]
MLYWILWIILAPFIFILLPTRVIGRKYYKLTKKKATIFATNHQSLNDPIVLKVRVNPNFKLMAKSSLFKTKFTNWFLRKLGAYPVNRGGNDITAVKTSLTHLKNNKHLVIFPEGTRGNAGDLNNLKDGVATFALKTDCYVVPAIFKKKPRVLSFNTLLIGKPFKFSDFEEFKGVKATKEIIQKASEILSEKLKFLK